MAIDYCKKCDRYIDLDCDDSHNFILPSGEYAESYCPHHDCGECGGTGFNDNDTSATVGGCSGGPQACIYCEGKGVVA